MAAGANVPYNPISEVTPAQESPTPERNVRATPESFGAQVGQGLQAVGQEDQQAATRWAALGAETEANQKEVAYIQAQGALRTKYDQYEGMAAYKMQPQFEKDSSDLQAQYKEGLSPAAARLYDNNSRRYFAQDTNSYAGYAATQYKQANVNSHKAIVDQTTALASSPSRVTNPALVGQDLGMIKHSANAQADLGGLTTNATGFDKDTQTYTWPDTDDGKAQAAQYHDFVDKSQTPYIINSVKTIASAPGFGPLKAADWIEQNKDIIPPTAMAQVNQFLAPKMKNEMIAGSIGTNLDKYDNQWHQNVIENAPALPGQPKPEPDLLGVINKHEGFTGRVGRDSNGANVINGVNEKAFPDDFATISAAYGKSNAAGEAATNDFFQKNIIDKYNIKSLPVADQAIVADGLVNHGINDKPGNFGASLLKAAQDGATPQHLIDMRRQEYNWLAASDTDGSKGYRDSLKGWNNRLDSLQGGQTGYANQAEFLRAKEPEYMHDVTQTLQNQGLEPLEVQQGIQRAQNEWTHRISVADNALHADQKSIDDAIGGSLTKGQPITTESQLRSLPGMADTLDRVQREQNSVFNQIPTKIAKAQHANSTQNSPNAYDAILSSLDTSGKWTRQDRIDFLSKGLGSDNPEYSISYKDYNDAKPAIDLEDGQDTISSRMKEISAANGDVDGHGKERSVAWYNQTMAAWKANQGKDHPLSATEFFDKEKGGMPAYAPPSRQQQINNVAKEAQSAGKVLMMNPDGKPGYVPASQVDDAIKANYKKVQ